MSTYRIFVDSRDRKSGTATNFEYALPFSLPIAERSLANIDVVVLPNSIQTVQEGKNGVIYLRETLQNGNSTLRYPKLPPGYYTVETLRVRIENSINNGRTIPGPYIVEYDERLARYLFSNGAIFNGNSFTLYTKDSPENPAKPASYPNIQNGNNGSFKMLGLERGSSYCFRLK